VAEWRTPAGTRGEVCWRIASDDAPFRKALGAIFDRQVKLFLKANMRSDGPPSR
jgi:hypothetical protein